jgi:dipeptide transport system permease protein
VTLSLACGIVLGLTASFAGGLVDTAIMRLMDIVLVLPSLLLGR